MTEAQKEEEQLIKTTFGFYERNKGGTPVEVFELPMLLEGKSFIRAVRQSQLHFQQLTSTGN